MSPEPMERRKILEIDEHGERAIEEDLVAERQIQIRKVTGIIWLIVGIIEALIGIRVLLRLLAANPENEFASFIYRLSRLFLMPFFGLVGEPTSDGSVLELASLIAMAVYLLVGWGIVRLVELIMMPSQVRHEKTIERH